MKFNIFKLLISSKSCQSASKEAPCVPTSGEYARRSLQRVNIEQKNSMIFFLKKRFLVTHICSRLSSNKRLVSQDNRGACLRGRIRPYKGWICDFEIVEFSSQISSHCTCLRICPIPVWIHFLLIFLWFSSLCFAQVCRVYGEMAFR